ncbi:glycosyltransferase family 2 protein [Candidatus Bathyarchaeota archaeon]|nr:glycosyltransferase family 2 protein [Candidatus Bathyarchaeota archaeon]
MANGDICPFVGHNAFLRWRAVQDAAAHTDPDDGQEKYWSESHVSEDFDMALRLQGAGYQLRFAAYSAGGFQEGVSLTVYDELARWEKYAYGCNELLFHPLRFWIVRGPFAPVFKQFLFSRINFYHKLTIVAYIGTYYAIGAGWVLVLLNYFLTGWFFGLYDKYYIDSFAVWLSVVVVFAGVGNLALAVLRYRLGEAGILHGSKSPIPFPHTLPPNPNIHLTTSSQCTQANRAPVWNNFKWIPLFTIFLGGLSLHMSKALLCHFFEIDIQWGATAKEAEQVNFLEEVPKILRGFAGTFIFCIGCTALMVVAYHFFPREWRIQTFASIFPLGMLVGSSFCVPVLLNPALMKFTF